MAKYSCGIDFGLLKELGGITDNLQSCVGIRVDQRKSGYHGYFEGADLPRSSRNWRCYIPDENSSAANLDSTATSDLAVFDGHLIFVFGLSLTRKEVRLGKKFCPSALVVASVKDGSTAKLQGVTPGDIIITIGAIATTSLKGIEIVELINQTINHGEKVRFSFEPQEASRRPYSLTLGTAVNLSRSPSAADSQRDHALLEGSMAAGAFPRRQRTSSRGSARSASRPQSGADFDADDEQSDHPGEYV